MLEPQWGFLPEFTPLERGKEKEEGEKPSRLEKICNGVVLGVTEASDSVCEGDRR